MNNTPSSGIEQLEFNRGGGLFARILHIHSEIIDQYHATGMPAEAVAG